MRSRSRCIRRDRLSGPLHLDTKLDGVSQLIGKPFNILRCCLANRIHDVLGVSITAHGQNVFCVALWRIYNPRFPLPSACHRQQGSRLNTPSWIPASYSSRRSRPTSHRGRRHAGPQSCRRHRHQRSRHRLRNAQALLRTMLFTLPRKLIFDDPASTWQDQFTLPWTTTGSRAAIQGSGHRLLNGFREK